MLFFDGFSSERAVSETDQAHVALYRVAEDMTESIGVGLRFWHCGKEGVTSTETNDHFPR